MASSNMRASKSPCLAGAASLLLAYLGQHQHVGVPSVSAFAANKKVMPEAELIKRRKSPALWRYDLSNIDDDEHAKISDVAKWYPDTPPEIMSPAGGFPQLRAAIANGADSVYLGCSAFSARAR